LVYCLSCFELMLLERVIRWEMKFGKHHVLFTLQALLSVFCQKEFMLSDSSKAVIVEQTGLTAAL
jgi:hypothetical protein